MTMIRHRNDSALALIFLFVSFLVVNCITEAAVVELWNSGTCPYAQRAWIALVEKGIPFVHKTVDLQAKSEEFQEVYEKANPNPLASSKVPVLVVENQVFTESKTVLEAIEELWPEAPALLPRDNVQERAKCRMFAEAVYDVVFGGSRSPYQIAIRASQQNGVAFDEEQEQKSLCESLKALDESLGGLHSSDDGPFLLGDCFSFAECMVAPFVQRADAILQHYAGFNVAEICQTQGYTRAAAWWQAVLKRDSVVATGLSPEKVIENSKRLLEMMKARQAKE